MVGFFGGELSVFFAPLQGPGQGQQKRYQRQVSARLFFLALK
jgi:hypothetical protein